MKCLECPRSSHEFAELGSWLAKDDRQSRLGRRCLSGVEGVEVDAASEARFEGPASKEDADARVQARLSRAGGGGSACGRLLGFVVVGEGFWRHGVDRRLQREWRPGRLRGAACIRGRDRHGGRGRDRRPDGRDANGRGCRYRRQPGDGGHDLHGSVNGGSLVAWRHNVDRRSVVNGWSLVAWRHNVDRRSIVNGWSLVFRRHVGEGRRNVDRRSIVNGWSLVFRRRVGEGRRNVDWRRVAAGRSDGHRYTAR
jgi:hypothetical protein